jgi:hypothetical protein
MPLLRSDHFTVLGDRAANVRRRRRSSSDSGLLPGEGGAAMMPAAASLAAASKVTCGSVMCVCPRASAPTLLRIQACVQTPLC